MAKQRDGITVGELIEQLAAYPDRFIVDFSGLEFSSLAQTGDSRVHLELSWRINRVRDDRRIAEAA